MKKTYSKLIRNSCGLNNFLTKLGPSADLGKSTRQKGITIKLSVNCGPRQGQNAMEKGGDWRREGFGFGALGYLEWHTAAASNGPYIF